MVQVFISYRHEERDVLWAERLAGRIESAGWTPWWDKHLYAGTQDWVLAIDAALRASQAIVVLWSKSSAKSRDVLAEVRFGFDAGRLIGAFIEDAIIPFRYGGVQSVFLHTAGERAIDALIAGIARMVDPANVEQAPAALEAARAAPPSPTQLKTWSRAAPAGAQRLRLAFLRPVQVLEPKIVFEANRPSLVRRNPKSRFLRRFFHERWLAQHKQPIAFTDDEPEGYARYAPMVAGFDPFAAFAGDVRLGAHRAPADPEKNDVLLRLMATDAAPQLGLSPLSPDHRFALLPLRPLTPAALLREQPLGELPCWLYLNVYACGVGVLELGYDRLALAAGAEPIAASEPLSPASDARLRANGEFWATPNVWFERLAERVDQAILRAGAPLAPLGPWRMLASLDHATSTPRMPPNLDGAVDRLERPHSEILVGRFGYLEAFPGNQARDVLWVQSLLRMILAREGLIASLMAEVGRLAAPTQAGVVWRKEWRGDRRSALQQAHGFALTTLKAASTLNALDSDPRRPPFVRALESKLRERFGLVAAQRDLAQRLGALGSVISSSAPSGPSTSLARTLATSKAIFELS